MREQKQSLAQDSEMPFAARAHFAPIVCSDIWFKQGILRLPLTRPNNSVGRVQSQNRCTVDRGSEFPVAGPYLRIALRPSLSRTIGTPRSAG